MGPASAAEAVELGSTTVAASEVDAWTTLVDELLLLLLCFGLGMYFGLGVAAFCFSAAA